MKALTLTQPWATAVAIGAKRIETRSWSTSYRGPLAIHAAKGFPGWAKRFSCEWLIKREMKRGSPALAFTAGLAAQMLPTGVVLATCHLADCIPTTRVGEISEEERELGDYAPGRFAWVLRDIVRLPEPIAAKGALGLWQWDFPGIGVHPCSSVVTKAQA